MATILESLIAKGRRANRPKEQREVSYGLADLSTHEEMHDRIVKKGGIRTLTALLSLSNDHEAQRFSALAIANCASSIFTRVYITQVQDALMSIIDFLKNDQHDFIARQYCAMAVGNLAALPETHGPIVQFGGIDSLISLLKFEIGKKSPNFETGAYAAFALSNLAANANHRQKIVDENAIEPLVLLACYEDINAQRHALSALRGICLNPMFRIKVVQLGILDPLILMSRSDNLVIIREVSAAFNCLSSKEENKVEIADRAISTIIALLLSGDDEVERHACCTVANLLEFPEVHDRFLEEKGLPALMSMTVTADLNTRGEASRALANLSSNADMHQILLREGALPSMVEALEKEDINCKRFASLCLANFSTTIYSQVQVVQAGAIRPLVNLVASGENHMESRRYSALVLANLSATVANHPAILEAGSLDALFSLANSPDATSQYYVGCALSNLSSVVDNHYFIIEKGGIQPIISLLYSSDPDIHIQAAGAMRGLSVDDNAKSKIVQEGGLEPLSQLLTSQDIEILREATACLCNLSLCDENKYEISKCGAIAPLIYHMQSEDMLIASQSSACLANVAEITEHQELITKEGGIRPCVVAMRSRFIEVQREAGRLLANLCASDADSRTTEAIIKEDGHHLLISFLTSQDTALQRVGTFGIGNLSIQDQHRVELTKSDALEPLCSLARSSEIELEIQRLAVLAIANLSSNIENHQVFMEDGLLTMMISLSHAQDEEVRLHSAYCVVKIAQNAELRELVTLQGGLEPVLFLARSDQPGVQREALPALAVLSFIDANKIDICNHGGLKPILNNIFNDNDDMKASEYATCALANLTEVVDNMPSIVNANSISLLVQALTVSQSTLVKREAARALGNLAAIIDYGEMIMEYNLLQSLISLLECEIVDVQRMSAMALCNLSTNIRNHTKLVEKDLFNLMASEFQLALDSSKDLSDYECVRFYLLILANLSVNMEYQKIIIDKFLGQLMQFTKGRDIKCRQHAIFALGNLCTSKENFEFMCGLGCLKIFMSFSFPNTIESTNYENNSQFQAIAAIHGITTHSKLRLQIAREGGLEPLILTASKTTDFEILRETASTFCNLALADENKMVMCRNGAIPALIKLAVVDDVTCQIHAIAALANLAEMEGKIQQRMLEEGCLLKLCNVIDSVCTVEEAKSEAIRCIALFSCCIDTHPQLLHSGCPRRIVKQMQENTSTFSKRFSTLAIGNLALSPVNHKALIDCGAISSVLSLSTSEDLETKRCVAFTMNNMALYSANHLLLSKFDLMKNLIVLLSDSDHYTQLESCTAVRHLCAFPKMRFQFLEYNGLSVLLHFSESNCTQTKREATAAIKNLSLTDSNKELIAKDGGLEALASICRSEDEDLSHQACSVIANLAECISNQRLMIETGIIQHMKFVLHFQSVDVKRECLRAIANLSFETSHCLEIVCKGILVPLIEALTLSDNVCIKFATMAIANLAKDKENQTRIMQEGALQPLINIASLYGKDVKEKLDIDLQRYSMYCLTNLAASKCNHFELLECGLFNIASLYINSDDIELRNCAVLCLANLASNSRNHTLFITKNEWIDSLIKITLCSDRDVQLHAVSAIRGLATDEKIRLNLIECKCLDSLLKMCKIDDMELQMEVLAAISNLSLAGCIGDNPNLFIEEINMNALVAYLCSANTSHRLFGALTIGNIASQTNLQQPLIDSGALGSLITLTNSTDREIRRSIAYAICNLATNNVNRTSIINDGGLLAVTYLSCSSDPKDMSVGLSTIRALAVSPVTRRSIIESGAMEGLLLGLKSEDNECRKEASSAICSLSLNDDNKVSLVNSKIVRELSITMQEGDDPDYYIYIIRTVANLCEKEKLIKKVVEAFDVKRLIDLSHKPKLSVTQEIARCFANITGNTCSHAALLLYKIGPPLAKFCVAKDVLVNRYASIALVNLSMNKENHSALVASIGVVASLLELAKGTLSSKRNEIDLKYDVKSRRYANLAIGGFCASHDCHIKLIQQGVIQVLLDTLVVSDEESQLNAAFALNKLAANENNFDDMWSLKVIPALIENLDTPRIHSRTQAISALRKLSKSAKIAVDIVSQGGLDKIAKSFQPGDLEATREVAACYCYLTRNETNTLTFLKSLAFEPMIAMCQNADVSIARFALGALANIAENQKSHKVLLERKNVMHFLVFLMRSRQIPILKESSRAVSNLLSTETAFRTLLNENGLHALFYVSISLDLDCRYNAALSFRKLASNSLIQEILIKQGSLKKIILLSETKNENVQLQASTALLDISSNHKYKIFFFEEGGFESCIISNERVKCFA